MTIFWRFTDDERLEGKKVVILVGPTKEYEKGTNKLELPEMKEKEEIIILSTIKTIFEPKILHLIFTKKKYKLTIPCYSQPIFLIVTK